MATAAELYGAANLMDEHAIRVAEDQPDLARKMKLEGTRLRWLAMRDEMPLM